MFEIFFILIVIYVTYVVTKEDEQTNRAVSAQGNNNASPVLLVPSKIEVSKNPPVKPQNLAKKTLPESAKAEPKKTLKSKTAAPKIELRTVVMQNPKTGEQAKVASNYRMVKRWIKEALVEEALLDKIYKMNEMDDTAKAKVAEALSIIKAMDKYKVS